MPKLNYFPSRHGFHFINNFTNHVGPITTYGLCGGWNGGQNQQFVIEPINDHYRVRARHSGLYLDIEGISLDNRARLIQWAWWAGNNQQFQFIPTS